MIRSEQINELAAALTRAQAAMDTAKRTAENPFFKSSYADLASVWATCREPLTKNGLSVVQTTDSTPEGEFLETLLMHSSGQWVGGRIAIKPVKNDPQGVGSAMTYARRYALMAIVGIASEDDDGNEASGKTEEVKPEKKAVPPKKAVEKKESVKKEPEGYTVTEDDLKGVNPIGRNSKGKKWSELSEDVLGEISKYTADPKSAAIAAKELLMRKVNKALGEIEAGAVSKVHFDEALADALKGVGVSKQVELTETTANSFIEDVKKRLA